MSEPVPVVLEPLYLAKIADMDRGLSEILSNFGTGALVWPLVGSHDGSGSPDLFPWSWSPPYLAEIADVDRGLSEILFLCSSVWDLCVRSVADLDL